MQHVVILGAGPAGLGAALQLRRRGLADVTVVDRKPTVGGLSGSFDVSGVTVDYGSHRLHAQCRPDILADIAEALDGDLLLRRRRGRIRLQGRWIAFPLSPLNLAKNLPPSVVVGTARDLARRVLNRERREPASFAESMESGVGSALCQSFYFPYARKVWGLEPENISPVQASRRVAARSVPGLVRKALASVSLRGKSQASAFYYPRRGYGQISQKLADLARAAGANVLLNAELDDLRVSADTSVAVKVRAGSESIELNADQVWSTIPVNALVNAVSPPAPPEIVEAGRSLRSRAMVLAYLTLSTNRFSACDTHYFPEENVPFTRVSEPKNFSGEGPVGETVLCVEIPTEIDSDIWKAANADVRDIVVDGLASAGLPVTATVTDTAVVHVPSAYPIYEKGFEPAFDAVDDWVAGLNNIVTFGRQGLFAHNNLHHVLEMAYAAVDCLDESGRFDRTLWADFRTAFDHQVVVD